MHLIAWQSITIALTLLDVTNTGVTSHCLPSELLQIVMESVEILQLHLDY